MIIQKWMGISASTWAMKVFEVYLIQERIDKISKEKSYTNSSRKKVFSNYPFKPRIKWIDNLLQVPLEMIVSIAYGVSVSVSSKREKSSTKKYPGY